MPGAAIQFLIYKPDPDHPLPEAQRGVVINPRLKQRFKQFVPIGVFLEGSNLRYYFFDQLSDKAPAPPATYKAPKIYSSLDELRQDLPPGLKNIFENKPKLFCMGHGSGGHYGLGNCHGPSEQLYDDNFDNLLSSFKHALPADHGEVFVTLEGCNTDSQRDAAESKQEKTFLERVSVKYPKITFAGTGPWEAHDPQTGFRSLAPEVPITSMSGNVWKAGNSVIFHHRQYQVAVRKSLFASTETAKALKVNTIEYARALLDKAGSDELIAEIALRRDILSIQDLNKIDGFPEWQLDEASTSKFFEVEREILGREQKRYLTRVRDILDRADPLEQLTDRDVIELLLGLQKPAVFEGHKGLLDSIIANKHLLNLLMVSCGKVLVGGPSNDRIIDFLLKEGADINSADEKGMTALHYVAQVFYNYRKEPLNLIKKLLAHGASLEVRNEEGQTPINTAQEHSKDSRVTGKYKLLASLKHGNSPTTPEELRQCVRQIFQMSQHKADELLSLPIEKREYSSCKEGTLYIPEDLVEKLLGDLESAKGNIELLLEFESELDAVISALGSGQGTGQVFDAEDELISKCFMDAKDKLAPVMHELENMKQELAASSVAEKPATAQALH